jgi:replication-associated recombination protein RarA
MEDVVDSFLVSVEGSESIVNSHKLKELLKKMGNLLPKGKTRRKIANKIKGIKILVKEVADRRDRYRVGEEVANLAATPTVDPRLLALFKDQKDLVGIDVTREHITKKLMDGEGQLPNKQLKIISIFGFGGLGKTTIAKVVYERLREKFVLKAFITVGQTPDVKKVLRDILFELDKEGYRKSDAPAFDEKQLIEKLQELLENKRYTHHSC